MESTRSYSHQFSLKYGCNPHQTPSNIYSLSGKSLPFSILNGKPGYINILDALNAWQLVSELKQALGLPAAASFKHVSPAGAAVANPLSNQLKKAYGVEGVELTPAATAYIRARNADPKSSFGDFVALSDVVDEATAIVLKSEVSDGIIAPGFEEKALEILKGKKSGNYVILKADENFEPPVQEFREVYGCVFEQRRNDVKITPDLFKNVVTSGNKELPPEAVRDLVLASITIKYTQSNSVGYAVDGQMIGIGAGQQSRVDCVKLAGQKAEVWYLRQHPKALNMQFSKNKKINRVTRINAMIRYVEGDFTDPEYKDWSENFDENEIPPVLTLEEKTAFMKTLKGVGISSDAFFPFRDNIDQASKRGVQYVAQPGGSVADENVIKACEEYGMSMVFTSVRLFQH